MTSKKPPIGFFVTGTDTEVGKTLVSAALLLKLQKHHTSVIGYKPVVAGIRLIDGQLQNEDLLTLALASNHPAAKEIENICPYVLKTASAPHLVAEKEQLELDYTTMLQGYQNLQNQTDAIIVEGVGGFKVPFHQNKDSADFAQDLGLPVILVVGMRLGCINHALLTVEAILSRGLTIAGWVANTVGAMNLIDENIQSLRQLIKAPLLGIIPQIDLELASTPYTLSALQIAASHLRLPEADSANS
jgi:dethiobiotin synthetase